MSKASRGSEPTVFIVDDNEGSRHSLGMLVETVKLKVETFSHPEDFLSKFQPESAGCVILDVRLPDMSGIDVLDHIRAQKSDIPVIVVTAYGDVPTAVQALKRGAIDFIEKPFSDHVILRQIQRCVKDSIARRAENREKNAVRQSISSLSPREREILGLITKGKSNREIGSLLNISMRTVENHRAHIRRKMKASNTAKLILMIHNQDNELQE